MTNATILTALKTTIENAAGLSYVKAVYLGKRDAMSVVQFPVIVIEFLGDVEEGEANTVRNVRSSFVIYAALNVVNADKQLVGDANTVGAMDFEDGIKKALDADETLGGVAGNLVIKSTTHASDNYPMREFSIEIEVWFRQIKGTRT
jgi:hypothetical protein